MKAATGAKELAETIRNAARRAVRSLEEKGKPLSEIIEQGLIETPTQMLKALAAYVPKQLEVEHRDADPLEDLNDDELAGLVSEARRITAARKSATDTGGPQVSTGVH